MAIALAVGDSGNITTADQALIDALEASGLTVDVYSQSTSRPSDDSGGDPYEGYAVAESVSSGTAVSNGWADNVSVPVLMVEAAAWDELSLSDGTSGGDDPETDIVIEDNSHDITSGFSEAALTVYSSSGRIGWHQLDSDLPAGTSLARWTTLSSQKTIMQLEDGATLGDGSTTANERRVFVGFYDAQLLNTDGNTLLTRAIEWVFADALPQAAALEAPLGAASVTGHRAVHPESQEVGQGFYARTGSGLYARVGGGNYARLVSGLVAKVGTVTAAGLQADLALTESAFLEAPLGAATFGTESVAVVTGGSAALEAPRGTLSAAGLTATAVGEQHVVVEAPKASDRTFTGISPALAITDDVFVDDFESYAVGEGMPDGWTARWGGSPNTTWSIADVGGDPGQVLRLESTSNGRRLASFDAIGTPVDVDIFAVLRTASVSTNEQSRLYARASGPSAGENAIYLEMGGPTGSRIELNYYDAGAAHTITEVALDWAANVWYAARLRVVGDSVRARFWQPADLANPTADEPSAWLIDETHTVVNSNGWAGVGAYRAEGENEFAVVRARVVSQDRVVNAPFPAAREFTGFTHEAIGIGPVTLEAPLGGASFATANPVAQVHTGRTIWDDGATSWDDGLTVWDVNTHAAPVGTASWAGISPLVSGAESPSAQGVYARTGGGHYKRVSSGFYARVTTGLAAPVGAAQASGLTASVSASDHQVTTASVGSATWAAEDTGLSTGGAQVAVAPRGRLTLAAPRVTVPIAVAKLGAVSVVAPQPSASATGHRALVARRGMVLVVGRRPKAVATSAIIIVPQGVVQVSAHPASVDVFESLVGHVVAPRGGLFANAFGADNAFPTVAHQRASLWRTIRARRRGRSERS